MGRRFDEVDDEARGRVLDRIQEGRLGLEQLPPRWQHLILEHVVAGLDRATSEEGEILWACVLGVRPQTKKVLDQVIALFKGHLMPPAERADMVTESKEYGEVQAPDYLVTKLGNTYSLAFHGNAGTAPIFLGSGASASVFLATEDEGEAVVVKIVKGGRRNDLLHFFLEYLKTQNLHGVENVIQTYDSGRYRVDEDTFFFIVQEYGGMSLAEEIARRRKIKPSKGYGVDEKRAIARQTLDVLQVFRERRILHLDIKPHNLFRVQNSVKVGDFGIATVLPPGVDAVQELFRGTPGYAPSQSFQGQFDWYTDLFGFARTMADLNPEVDVLSVFGTATYEQLVTWQRQMHETANRKQIVAEVEVSQQNALVGVVSVLERSQDRFERLVLVSILRGEENCPRTVEAARAMLDAVDILDQAEAMLGEHQAHTAESVLDGLRETYADEAWWDHILPDLQSLK